MARAERPLSRSGRCSVRAVTRRRSAPGTWRGCHVGRGQTPSAGVGGAASGLGQNLVNHRRRRDEGNCLQYLKRIHLNTLMHKTLALGGAYGRYLDRVPVRKQMVLRLFSEYLRGDKRAAGIQAPQGLRAQGRALRIKKSGYCFAAGWGFHGGHPGVGGHADP